ncbi:MAG TPA: hypothetical protein VHP30_05030 [Ignavibacteriales bacterium]|nr:hypothetical protein [Ignavibacteriales bacterium]
MKNVFFFILLFTAALHSQTEKTAIKVDEMSIVRKNIFWTVSLSLRHIDPGIPFKDSAQMALGKESFMEFHYILNNTKPGGWIRFLLDGKVKDAAFAANCVIKGKTHNFLINREEIFDLTAHDIYSPEGKYLKALASFIDKNKARLDSTSYRWNRLDQLHFTPDGSKLIAWCDSRPYGSIKIWSAKDGSLLQVLPLVKDNEAAWLLDINDDGTKLAYVSVYPGEMTDTLFCYSLNEGKCLWKKRLSEEGKGAFAINFSPAYNELAVINYEGVHVYNLEDGYEKSLQQGPLQGFKDMDARLNQNYANISPSGKYAAAWQTGGFHGYSGRFSGITEYAYKTEAPYEKIRIWDVEENKVLHEIDVHGNLITGNVYFTPDEKTCVFKSSNGKINLFSMESGKITQTWTDTAYLKSGFPIFIKFSSLNKYMAVAYEHGAQIWDFKNKAVLKDFNRIQARREDTYKKSYPLAFSPDEKYFAMEYYGELRLYDVNTFEPVWSVLSWPEDNERIWTDVVEKN